MKTRWMYFEEYRVCTCVSPYVEEKEELLGYCPIHGNETRHVHRVPYEKDKIGR